MQTSYSKNMHAWYSKKAAALFGSSIYLSENNEEIEVTCVANDLNFGNQYLWDDKVYVGKVTKCLKRNEPQKTTNY